MSYTVPIFRAMIASPSDTQAIRDGLYERMLEFNFRDAEGYKFAFQPILWEHHAPASSGQEPQEVLDDQLVNKADILLAVFYRKFGNPAGGHPSGTVHEIEMFADPDNGRNPSVIFIKDKTKIKAPEREKILGYKSEIQSKGFLTQEFATIPQAIELGFRSILHQAVQLKAELDKKLQETDSKELVEIEESAPTLTYEQLEEELEEEAAESSGTPMQYPLNNINRSIAEWSDGLRFPMNKSMQEAFKNANRIASMSAYGSMSEPTKSRMQQISKNLGFLVAQDKNWEAKKAVQVAMKAIDTPELKDFRFSISQNEQSKKWILENTGSQSVLIETLCIEARPNKYDYRDEALDSYDEIRLESGESKSFDIPETYLSTAESAEIVIEYRRGRGELKKGKLYIKGV